MEELSHLNQTEASPSNTENNEQSVEKSAEQEQSDADKNFAALRDSKNKIEQERDDYLQRIKVYEEQQKKAATPPKKEKYRDPSDLAEYQDLMDLRKEMEEAKSQQTQLSMEIKLRQNFPDIDAVLSKENIAKFSSQEPELAAMLSENNNMYSKAAIAYKHIKRMNDGSASFQQERDAISANASKPRSSASVGKASPISEVNDLISNPEERRKRLYREMQAASQRK